MKSKHRGVNGKIFNSAVIYSIVSVFFHIYLIFFIMKTLAQHPRRQHGETSLEATMHQLFSRKCEYIISVVNGSSHSWRQVSSSNAQRASLKEYQLFEDIKWCKSEH